MRKTHYVYSLRPSSTICGRNVTAGTRTAVNVYAVDCGACKNQNGFVQDFNAAETEKQARFEAQEPRKFVEPWRSTTQSYITCGCGSELFRDRGRSCMGHYQDYVCASCGTTTSRLTETGMSF